MQKPRKTLLAAVAGPFIAVVAAPAAVLVTEPFDYNVGLHAGDGANPAWDTTMGTGSGTGWGGNEWSDHIGGTLNFRISTGGHTGTFADSTGLSSPTGAWRQRNMATPVHSNTVGAVIWEHLTVSVTGTGTAGWLATESSYGGMHFAVRVEADGTYGLSTGQGHLFFDTSAISASSTATMPDVIVVKMENVAGGLFDVSMWVNPSAATAAGLPAPDLQILGTTPFAGNLNIGDINWRPGQTQIDNFILATDYTDFGIVPEPSAAVLIAFGGLAMGMRRSRR